MGLAGCTCRVWDLLPTSLDALSVVTIDPASALLGAQWDRLNILYAQFPGSPGTPLVALAGVLAVVVLLVSGVLRRRREPRRLPVRSDHGPLPDIPPERLAADARGIHSDVRGGSATKARDRFRASGATTCDTTGDAESVTRTQLHFERLAYVLENFSEAIAIWDVDDCFITANSAFRNRFEMAAEQLAPGMHFRRMLEIAVEGGLADLCDVSEETFIERRMKTLRNLKAPVVFQHKGRSLQLSEQILPDGALVTCYRDVTEQKQQEARIKQLERLEAAGLLTGGVAHQFNNLLAVVMGNLELMLEALPKSHPQYEHLEAAFSSTERGADLTQHLLAFSRQQMLMPEATDLNAFLRDKDELLRRTLGPQIELLLVAGSGLWTCEVDPVHLESALLNLVVNARSAMAPGGTLRIETANRELDALQLAGLERAAPGPYVMLAVADDGAGIAPEVLPHIYEPFFTTRSFGESSGLGLSTVYGFVKQSRGHITVESALREGTTFAIYLPCVGLAGGR